MSELYIGLMSGTSADGIDAALVDFSANCVKIIDTHYIPYSETLRKQIISLFASGHDEIMRLSELDVLLGNHFAETANALLKKQRLNATDIKAIGSHGQTIRHYPRHTYRTTLQIADPNIIAAKTGITTIADFRRKDIALGGQGAPLVPAFHQYLFQSEEVNRVIVNIGGIANVTFLPLSIKNHDAIIGFDTGPGNALLDAWISLHQRKSHDVDGQWSAQGNVNVDLLNRLLSDPYFKLAAPKSSGREYFNQAWLETCMQSLNHPIQPVDVQATLAQLTAQSIMQAIQQCFASAEILICGGGAHNRDILVRMQKMAGKEFQIATTERYDIDPDCLEALAFAWLAKQTLHRKPGNLTSVTGASKASILGGVYYA